MMSKDYGSTSPIRVTRLDLASVGHRSYLIVDLASRVAAVVDPQPDVAPYLELAARDGAEIRHVFLTRLHPDFECGHRSLLAKTGAVIYTGAWANPGFPHLPVKNDDTLHFGATVLRILETPGHTLEGISIVASDGLGPGIPWGLFSGDLLFDGDVARPEPRLDDGFHVSQLAEMLHATLFRKILSLPPEVRVFPGHGDVATEPQTLGDLRKRNPMLQPMSRSTFVSLATAGMLPAPAHRGTRNSLNRTMRGPGESGPPEPLPRLSLEAFLARIEGGAIPLDLREPREFAAAHLRGSLNLGLGADWSEWAPALLDPTEDHVVIANPGSEAEALLRLTPLLGSRLGGALAGGMIALESRPDLLEQTLRGLVTPGPRASLAVRVDVRPAGEREQDAPDRGRRLPLEELLGRIGEVPSRRSALAVVDGNPYRAHAAASLLRRRGWARAHPLPPRAGLRSPA